MSPGLIRQGNMLNYLSPRATSQEYFWPWANVKSPGLRQIARLPVINKGAVIFKHMMWEPINISLRLSLMLNRPQLDQGFIPRNKEMKNLSCVCCAVSAHNCWYVGKSRSN